MQMVKDCGMALQYAPLEFRTEEVALRAVENAPGALEYVPDEARTEALLLKAGRHQYPTICS